MNRTSTPIPDVSIWQAPNLLCLAMFRNSSCAYARLSSMWRNVHRVIQASIGLRPLCFTYLSIASSEVSFRRSEICDQRLASRTKNAMHLVQSL